MVQSRGWCVVLVALNCRNVSPMPYGKSLCYQVPPFIMDYKHGVVETQRNFLVLVHCNNAIVILTILFVI